MSRLLCPLPLLQGRAAPVPVDSASSTTPTSSASRVAQRSCPALAIAWATSRPAQHAPCRPPSPPNRAEAQCEQLPPAQNHQFRPVFFFVQGIFLFNQRTQFCRNTLVHHAFNNSPTVHHIKISYICNIIRILCRLIISNFHPCLTCLKCCLFNFAHIAMLK